MFPSNNRKLQNSRYPPSCKSLKNTHNRNVGQPTNIIFSILGTCVLIFLKNTLINSKYISNHLKQQEDIYDVYSVSKEEQHK